MIKYIKRYLAIRKFNKKLSYFTGEHSDIHVMRRISNYENQVFDIDWVLHDERKGLDAVDYILPHYNSVRCCADSLVRTLEDIEQRINTDVLAMQAEMYQTTQMLTTTKEQQ